MCVASSAAACALVVWVSRSSLLPPVSAMHAMMVLSFFSLQKADPGTHTGDRLRTAHRISPHAATRL